MNVRRIPASLTHDLRHRILRPDQAPHELARPGDDDADTSHFGAYDGDRLVAVATIMREPEPDGPGDWRIRGVATEPDARGRGFGRAVIEACVTHARDHGARCVWLNGRVPSEAFYRALGFRAVGEPFDTPPSGMHSRFRQEV